VDQLRDRCPSAIRQIEIDAVGHVLRQFFPLDRVLRGFRGRQRQRALVGGVEIGHFIELSELLAIIHLQKISLDGENGELP